MAVFLLLLVLVIFNKIEFSGPDEFNARYIDKATTASISGIFVVLIVFSHYIQYVENITAIDLPYMVMRGHLKQLVVVPFLFYTGYGMMESLKRKGRPYIKGLPEKFLKLLFRFDVAVLLFLIMGLILGKHYSIGKVLLALTAWTPIGNSNWYIFDILILYILMFIAFNIDEHFSKGKNHIIGVIVLTVLVIGFVFLMMKLDMPSRYYNTIFTACVGCIYSLLKDRAERLIMTNDLIYFLILALIIVAYILLTIHVGDNHIETYTMWTIAFAGLMIVLSMKVKIDNGILRFFGSHVFSIYILQRIPMTILDRISFIDQHKYMSLIMVFAITIPFAIIFEKATDLVINKR